MVGSHLGEIQVRRYWVEKEAKDGDYVRLTGDTLHHIRDVCRMHAGSKFEVIVEGGHAHLVEIITESKKESIAKILETRVIPDLPRPHLHLVLSVPRFPVLEAVLEKAVELGVKEVHPFFSEFSFIRTQTDVWDKKVPRFEKIVQSATQQCGRGELMKISDPVGLAEILESFNRTKGVAGLFAYEGAGTLDAKDGVERIRSKAPDDVWIFVGSEGGFSDKEVELFQSVGLSTVTLGPQVLRVETACVALISVLKYGLDLMR
jgi:16S rRNA (uracil1498-N3)-methyltransferase